MIGNPEAIIRTTTSTCPQCHKEIAAYLAEIDRQIHMKKSCSTHGDFDLVVSKHPWYYKGLTEYYFNVMPEKMQQKRYYIYLSNKCNLSCPICLLEPNQNKINDIPIDQFKQIIKNNKSARFYLYGAESTLQDNLEQWIRLIKHSGNLVNMHTNGIKIADYAYLKKLKDCGLDYVSLQFDGFNDVIYKKLRGQDLMALKNKALDNLNRLNISTGLNVTIAKGVNEDQINAIIDFAIKRDFIKDVSFATLSCLGSAGNGAFSQELLMPDELIDLAERQSNGRINRMSIFLFQKLYYALLSTLKIRRCYNFQHIALIRDNHGGYVTFDSVLKLKSFEKYLDKYQVLVRSSRGSAALYLFFKLLLNFISDNLLNKLKCIPINILIPGQMRNPKIPARTLLISFGTVCDFYKYDAQIAKYCGQGFCVMSKHKLTLTDSISDLSLFPDKLNCK
jgi:MoaA/NifB/PqqE/SkfB family radical SAM enzyme